jgi:hypothetical protein
LNDLGQVAYKAVFTDGTQALLTTRVPVAGDTNYDGTVDATDVATFLAHYGLAGTRAEGDFNSDGVVGFNDFQMLELNFGRHPPGVAAGAVDDAALAAFGQSVPEPAAVVWLAAVALCAPRRRRRGRRS